MGDSMCSTCSCSRSLKHLKLRARDRQSTFMGSLRNFATLSTLETDWPLLVADCKLETLAEVLPCSVRQIHLHTEDRSTLNWANMHMIQIDYLLDNKNEICPVLEELRISHLRKETADTLGRVMKTKAQTSGVQLILDTTRDSRGSQLLNKTTAIRKHTLPDNEYLDGFTTWQ